MTLESERYTSKDGRRAVEIYPSLRLSQPNDFTDGFRIKATLRVGQRETLRSTFVRTLKEARAFAREFTKQ